MQPFLSKDTRNKIVEVKVDGLPASCQKDMPTISISEDNESLLLNCRAKKMREIVEIISEILTTQYICTCKSAYTKGYALN